MSEAGKDNSLQLARLKAASEDYKVHKSIFVDPVTDEKLEGFLEWPAFRDQFLNDWINNRRVVTEKEADVIFDRIADESLTELENLGSNADVAALAEQVAASEESTEEAQDEVTPATVVEPGVVLTTEEAPAAGVAPKRRGRPPGSGKKPKLAIVVSNDTPAAEAAAPAKRKSYYVPVSERKAKAAKPAAKASKPKVKAAAAKKKGKSTSERAAEIVAWGQSRKWARKDIIERMVARIDGLGAAYAGTLYQKFAN